MILKRKQTCNILLILKSLTIYLNQKPTLSESTYSKYPHYPKYCSKQSEMHKRSIPPCNSTTYPKTQLLQVNTVIRHGARTPWSNKKCWDNMNFQWDCSLQTVLGPPVNKDNVYRVKPNFLFDKNYDAFEEIRNEEKEEERQSSTFLLSNFLNGTCELGQLLQEGYDQQIQNGKILRMAYMNPRSKSNLNLFLNLPLDQTYTEPYIYFRSDDMPRTIMSGQVLLSSLFGTSMSTSEDLTRIVVHTADYVNDILIPNPISCPKLNDIAANAKNSQEYQQILQEMHTHASMQAWNDIGGDEKNIMDCLMTTICTDRILPDVINDFDGIEDDSDKTSTFTQLMEYDTKQWSYLFTFNNAQYSKLATGPLWAEIMDNIALTKTKTSIHQNNEDAVPRLTLFSGHDDTIMPLLASISTYFQQNMIWTAYASMLIIEIHGVLNDNDIINYAFRLLYNGEIITQYVDGCTGNHEDQLCDLDVLVSLVEPFATRDRDCTSHETVSTHQQKKSSKPKPSFGGFVLLSFICTLLGALFTYIYMTFLVVDNVQYGSANLENEGDAGGIESNYKDNPGEISRRPEIHFI